MPAEFNGAETTERDSSSDSAPTTQRTPIISGPLSMTLGSEESQPADSSKPSVSLKQEASGSMFLLSDTARHLHGLMKGLTTPPGGGGLTDQFVHALDPDRAKTAVECGKQLISTMRMQLDIAKFIKSLDEK